MRHCAWQIVPRRCWENDGKRNRAGNFAEANGKLWRAALETLTVPAGFFSLAPENLAPPPQAVTDFIERAIRNSKYYDGPDFRNERRHAVSLRVAAVPVDEHLNKIGEGFIAATRDISSGGIAIYHTRGTSDRFLALEISAPSGEKLHLLLEVLRCRPAGLFYEIAGRFISKIAS